MNDQRHRAERMLRSAITALAGRVDGHLGHLDPGVGHRGCTMRSIRESLGYPLAEATFDELNSIHQMLEETLTLYRENA